MTHLLQILDGWRFALAQRCLAQIGRLPNLRVVVGACGPVMAGLLAVGIAASAQDRTWPRSARSPDCHHRTRRTIPVRRRFFDSVNATGGIGSRNIKLVV